MSISVHENQKILASLRWRWGWYALLVIIFFAEGFFLLTEAWRLEDAWRWLALSLAVFVYELWTLWGNLKENHRPGEETLLPGLGAGNLVSLFRGALIAALYGFLFSPAPAGWLTWVPGVLYTVAALVDYIDGALARLTNHATRLGEILDMYFDGLGMLAATALIVQYGQVPVWYLFIGLARYLFLFGMWLRERLGKRNYPMPPSVRRRGMAAVQMGFVFVMLWPLFSPPGTHVVAYAFGLPLLIGFLWDWFYVSGVVSSDTIERYSSIKDFILRWVPVGLRLGVLLCALPALLSAAEQSLLVQFGWIVLILVVVGAAGRVASIAGLIVIGLLQMAAPLAQVQLMQGILYSLILLLGTGAFSLWKPEEVLIYQKLGERPLRRFQKVLETETK
jgi:CDP-diacylglycerol--glycerol-3-phosphate 3-phosphatidyltransferase